MLSIRDEQALARLHEFFDDNNISCAIRNKDLAR